MRTITTAAERQTRFPCGFYRCVGGHACETLFRCEHVADGLWFKGSLRDVLVTNTDAWALRRVADPASREVVQLAGDALRDHVEVWPVSMMPLVALRPRREE